MIIKAQKRKGKKMEENKIELSNEEKNLILLALQEMRTEVNKQIMKLLEMNVVIDGQEEALKKIEALIKKLS